MSEIDTFFDAVEEGDIEKIQRFIENEAVPSKITNCNGFEAIHIATSRGHLEVVKYLLGKEVGPKVLLKVGTDHITLPRSNRIFV